MTMVDEILFPDETILKTGLFEVNQDWEIPIPGFFIIKATRKMRSVSEFTDEEALEFVRILRKVRVGMREILKIQDVYLFQNEDTRHNFHLWLFPRHHWMERFGRKIESVRPIMEYAKENRTREEILEEVRGAAKKMRAYLKDF